MFQYIVLEFFFVVVIFDKEFILKDKKIYNIVTIKVQLLIKRLIFVFHVQNVSKLYIYLSSTETKSGSV